MTTIETPSKAAAAALSNVNINTPTKPADGTLLAKLKAAAAADTAPVKPDTPPTETTTADAPAETGAVEEWRKRFVGDVDCKESDEPLLQATTSRFVLFPIKYREVGVSFLSSPFTTLTGPVPDLANVQTGSSQFLDFRGDQPRP